MPNYRNPNGYGSVVKLSGRRRNKYAVRRTVGYDDRAFPIYKIIGYYSTRKDAVIALAEYNHSPYDIDLAQITFEELYERWSKSELPKMSKALASAHRTSYRYCDTLKPIRYKDLRKYHFQECIDNCGKGYATQNILKNLLVTLDKYAFDNEIIAKCYTANIRIAPKEESAKHTVFSTEEIKTLWEHQGEPYIDETLFQLYTGTRVSEMLTIRCEDIADDFMRGGVKSAAGRNRYIPIHPKLLPIIEDHKRESGFLFDFPRSGNAKDPELALKSKYLTDWAKAMKSLGMDHTTHDCRHTFRTYLDRAGANKVCIDLIMGHKTSDVGERVYTHKTLSELSEAIQLLDYGV